MNKLNSALLNLITLALLVLTTLQPGAALAHPPGVMEWVSVSSDGTGANHQSDMPAISADGRFCHFLFHSPTT